jgi:hypothetical protein
VASGFSRKAAAVDRLECVAPQTASRLKAEATPDVKAQPPIRFQNVQNESKE